jgi:predicted lipid-binding transport protein (Tim44 family)
LVLERQLQAQQTQSIASNLIANNININTNKTTTIVGSNLQANANNAVNSDNANNAVNTAVVGGLLAGAGAGISGDAATQIT